ncbi:DUF4136 domain-containing protein [Pontibacter rugosus]|uniref:DUF4136 domain-containing protein n=2 Tax=Pontibacter rugosus TaxID=1745966 RepID=A0ABW3SUK8_9BACT
MKLIKLPLILAVCLTSVFLPSCVTTSASFGANAIKAPYATNLRNYKTYAWFQNMPPEQADYLKGFNGDLNKNIRKAIEQELEERGYTKVAQNPDVLVAYDVSVSVPVEKDKPENFAEGFGYSYGYMSGYRYNYGHTDMPGYRNVDLFKKGTLIIDMINPKSDLLLWRGWTEGAINNFKSNYGTVHSKVEEVMEKL